jgi:hypothetical protein
MKKGNKKLLVIALLLLLLGAGIGTYAIYRSTSVGTATVSTAKWSVKVNSADMETQTFTFRASDVNWTTNTSAVSGKIAPGSSGTLKVIIDATGSEVPVDYTVNIDSVKINGTAVSNTGFTVTPAVAADMSGTIAYSSTSMTKTVTLNVVWTGTNSDTTAKDSADKAMNNKNVDIQVTVTAKQHI